MLELADGSQQQDRPFQRAEFVNRRRQGIITMAQNAFRLIQESLNERLVNRVLSSVLNRRVT